MVSSLTAEPVANPSPRTSLKATAPEFRLLGLRPREARLEVIRRALTETAGDVKASEHWAGDARTGRNEMQQDDGRLAQVAVAGYRLLDPRRRRTLFERVQLLLWSEDDLDITPAPLWEVPPVDDAGASQKSAGLRPAAQSQVANDSFQPARLVRLTEETQAALEVIRSLRSRDRRANALWISVAALAISLPGAVALVLALI